MSEGDSKVTKYTPQQIVQKLRQADVELGKGKTIKETCRIIEISE